MQQVRELLQCSRSSEGHITNPLNTIRIRARVQSRYLMALQSMKLVLLAALWVVAVCHDSAQPQTAPIRSLQERTGCLGAPYLYLTQNGKPHVLKYSRDGCLLSNNILAINPEVALLRSMIFGPYKGIDDALFIADAGKTDHKDSKILVYGSCNTSGIRPFLATAVQQKWQSGAMHAYGLAIDSKGDLYASFQRSQSVIRFSADTFKPGPLSEALQNVSPPPAPGTFFRFSFDSSGEGIRAIAIVADNLWIADEKDDALNVVDSNGYKIRKVPMRRPIGVYYCARSNLVFASSRSSYGMVYAVNPVTFEIRRRYHYHGMTHPTGIVSYENILFVLLHHSGLIVTFDITSGKYLSTIASGFEKNTLEQIVLSNC